MCSYVTLEYRKNKMSKQHFLIWLIFIFLTGPIGFIIYIFWNKKKRTNFKKGNRM
ncbi:PLDc N-terminal domain-containing protein [Bacillus cereus]|nr:MULTISPECIES: PLDc N-terminal domain-containing protein [Bacillus cereus group]MCX3317802.1 PLDc N-terminal domain-containing protein [Bacillus paranthracis]MDH8000915.1 PLDc N-terminal domain-containing protein [Bacillus cereus]